MAADDSRKLLRIYLQDHHAAAAAGLDLARRLARENRSWGHGPELQQIAGEIAGDRATVRTVLDRLGIAPSVVKIAGARALERVGRLKLNGRVTSYSPLSRVLELELLASGVNAKLELWRTLAAVQETEQSLQPFDFGRLVDSATAQLERLERIRRAAVGDAFDVAPGDV